MKKGEKESVVYVLKVQGHVWLHAKSARMQKTEIPLTITKEMQKIYRGITTLPP